MMEQKLQYWMDWSQMKGRSFSSTKFLKYLMNCPEKERKRQHNIAFGFTTFVHRTDSIYTHKKREKKERKKDVWNVHSNGNDLTETWLYQSRTDFFALKPHFHILESCLLENGEGGKVKADLLEIENFISFPPPPASFPREIFFSSFSFPSSDCSSQWAENDVGESQRGIDSYPPFEI